MVTLLSLPCTATPVDLGQAGNFAAFGLLDEDVVISSGNTTITSVDPLTVVQLRQGINLNKTLTIAGGSGDAFVFNVPDGQTIALSGGGQIVLTGGVTPDNILFNVMGSHGGGLTFTGDSDTVGTFLGLDRAITVSGRVHDGAFLAGGRLTLQSGPHLEHPSVAVVPAPGALVLGCSGPV